MATKTNTSINLTADGDSDAEALFPTKPLQCEAVFTSGTGTMKLQAKAAGGEWVDVPNCSFTAAGRANTLIFASFGENFRANLSGSAGSPDITLILTEVMGFN